MGPIDQVALICASICLLGLSGGHVFPHNDEFLILGTWELVQAVDDGVERHTDRNRITVAADAWTAGEHVFKYRMYPHTQPKQIDWTIAGQVQRGIYELDGNRLRMCVSPLGKPRPTEFETHPGDGRSLHLRRRVEPKPP
jgi:uncharacterized protein (TIGR03067 family)